MARLSELGMFLGGDDPPPRRVFGMSGGPGRGEWTAEDLERLVAAVTGRREAAALARREAGGRRLAPAEVGHVLRGLPEAPPSHGAIDGCLGRLYGAFAGLSVMDRAGLVLWAVDRCPASEVAGIAGSGPELVEGRMAGLLEDLHRQALRGGGGCRLLIAEDEAIAALDLREALEEMGHEAPWSAVTAGQAISAASLHQPELAFMDIRLAGGTDGIPAARELQDALGVPVILMTAYADQAARAASVRPYGFLPKPWRERELARVLRAALTRLAIERFTAPA